MKRGKRGIILRVSAMLFALWLCFVAAAGVWQVKAQRDADIAEVGDMLGLVEEQINLQRDVFSGEPNANTVIQIDPRLTAYANATRVTNALKQGMSWEPAFHNGHTMEMLWCDGDLNILARTEQAFEVSYQVPYAKHPEMCESYWGLLRPYAVMPREAAGKLIAYGSYHDMSGENLSVASYHILTSYWTDGETLIPANIYVFPQYKISIGDWSGTILCNDPNAVTIERDPEADLENSYVVTIREKYSGNSIFSARLVCSDCGERFGSKVWNSTDKYRRTIWQCNGKYKGEHRCTTPHLEEQDIRDAFVAAFNSLIRRKDELIRNCRFVMDRYTDCADLDSQLSRLEDELAVVTGLIQKWVAENAKTAQDTEAFMAKCREYDDRYRELQSKVEAIEEEKRVRQGRVKRFELFLQTLKKQHGELTEFDESTWLAVIDTVLVKPNGKLVFRFANGMEVER